MRDTVLFGNTGCAMVNLLIVSVFGLALFLVGDKLSFMKKK